MKLFASILKVIPILGLTFILWVALTTVVHTHRKLVRHPSGEAESNLRG